VERSKDPPAPRTALLTEDFLPEFLTGGDGDEQDRTANGERHENIAGICDVRGDFSHGICAGGLSHRRTGEDRKREREHEQYDGLVFHFGPFYFWREPPAGNLLAFPMPKRV